MATDSEYALMAGRAYRTSRHKINWFPIPQGWQEYLPHGEDLTGFEAVSFKRGNEIVISFAGTDEGKDWWTNMSLVLGDTCSQLHQAALYYCDMKAAFPSAEITFTGHSLGGGLASLLGVFFKKKAVTFDQAPFRKAADPGSGGLVVADNLYDYLQEKNVSESLLKPLLHYGSLYNREFLVTSLNVQGEVLSCAPATFFSRIGVEDEIKHGSPQISGIDLHSMSLLAAFLQNDEFRAITSNLPVLLPLVFENDLYCYDVKRPNADYVNFLENLIQRQEGFNNQSSDGVLTRFTEDMEKIAPVGGMTMEDTGDLTKALIAFAMQAHYEDRLGAGEKLFDGDGVGGGIHFDRTKVADSLADAKGFTYLNDFLLRYPAAQRATILEKIPDLQDWYIQAGSRPMTASAGSNSAFLLGGAGGDTLTARGEEDILIDGDGADTLR